MNTFQEMPLARELHSALMGLKFVEPTDIQTAVIPISMDGADVMACAETGSGKTGAYAIPMVERLLENTKRTALVLAPTRELAIQIADFIRELVVDCRGLQVATLVGGADIRKQFRQLQKNPRIVVATPGRLTDHLERNTVQLGATEILVLDEGDRMLDMGFAPQLDVILEYVPKKRQTSLFTATLPEKVQKLARKYLNDPVKINVGRASLPVASIKQSVAEVTFKEKDNRIVDELNQREGSVIVFARTKHRTDRLAQNLASYGFDVDLIHGGRSQGQRNQAIRNFKRGKSRILCATDVAARGIDIPQVEHVINFDLPTMEEDYVHRIGRTARNGAAGEAVSFVMPDEHRIWRDIAKKYKIQGVELEGAAMAAQKKIGAREGSGGRRPSGGSSKFSRDSRSKRDSRPRRDSDRKPRRARPDREESAEGSRRPKPTIKTDFKKKRSFKSEDEKRPSRPARSGEDRPTRSKEKVKLTFKKSADEARSERRPSKKTGYPKRKPSESGEFSGTPGKKKFGKKKFSKKKPSNTASTSGFKKKSGKPPGKKKSAPKKPSKK